MPTHINIVFFLKVQIDDWKKRKEKVNEVINNTY